MDITTERKYIVKQSTGQEWLFFYDTQDGICFKKKAERHWEDYEILIREGMGDFDIMVDDSDYIHLVCQDRTGSILYLLYKKQQWHKYVILKSKSKAAYPKHFRILHTNHWVNLIYTIQYKGQTLLVHHILDNTNVPPNVIDVIANTKRPFCATSDNSNNIYVFYERNTPSAHMGYKTYVWSKKVWSDFIPLQDKNTNIESPCVLIDRKDNIHLAYLKKTGDSYHIAYKRKPYLPPEKTSWEEEITVFNHVNQDAFPVMMIADHKLWMLWQQNSSVLSSFSQDDGKTWSKPTQFMAGRYGDIGIYGYRTAVKKEENNIVCPYCYGYSNKSDIVFYVLSSYLGQLAPNQPKPPTARYRQRPKPQYRKPGYEVEEFARQNMHSFAPSSSSTTFSPEETSGSEPITSPGVEVTKLKIAVDMLKEEMAQIKKNLTDQNVTDYIDQKFDSILEGLKNQNAQLAEKITNLEQRQNTLANAKIDEIYKEIARLKRSTFKMNFQDLVDKAKSNE